uniref:Uncharacterized protein n=1 Tax=Cucumis melo TaxID=3656 RepID=A0A9I9EEH4_CUCME
MKTMVQFCLHLSKMTMMVQLRFRFSKDDIDNAALPPSL